MYDKTADIERIARAIKSMIDRSDNWGTTEYSKLAKAAIEASTLPKELENAEARIAELLITHEKEKAMIRIELGDYEEVELD